MKPIPAGATELTVVLPTYNERDRLGEVVATVFDVCSRHDIAAEIVVVDDNSPDGTGALADQLARDYPVIVVHRAGKLGLGSAVVAGFGVATGSLVCVLDADLSHPPRFLPEMMTVMRRTGADAVVASRYVPGARIVNWPLSRLLMSRLACLLARPLVPVRDATSGFFLVRRDFATRVRISAKGFKICLELLVRGHARLVAEIPVTFTDRTAGESKMNMREALGYVRQLWDLTWCRVQQGLSSRPRRIVIPPSPQPIAADALQAPAATPQ
jgi:dolichol-phosphate mannosyltransferase